MPSGDNPPMDRNALLKKLSIFLKDARQELIDSDFRLKILIDMLSIEIQRDQGELIQPGIPRE